MKALALLLAALPTLCFGDDVSQLLTEGQRAYTSGDLATARQDFQIILQIDPTNQTATNYLRMIRVAQPPGSASQDAEKEYASVRIPEVQLRDATLGSTLDYLKQLLEKQTSGKTQINFVVQLSPDVLQTQIINLKLADVPFTEVLRYVGDLAHVTFVFEKYAVVVKGVETSTPAPQPVPASP